MAQAVLDVIYKVTGLGALEKSQKAMDRVGKSAQTAKNKVVPFGNSTAKAGAQASKGSVGVNKFDKALVGMVGRLGLAAAASAAFAKSIQLLSQQDFAEAKVRSLGVNSEELAANLGKLSKELGYQQSQVELTAAAYDVASAGFNDAASAADVLKASALGATGGFAELNEVANATTSVLNAYGASSKDAQKYVDQFIQTQNDGKIVVAEYAANIGKVASAAAGLKIPLAEVNAIIAQSTAAGVQAEVAFTGVKSALARLASGEASTALKPLGVNINAATLASDGLIGTLEKIQASGADTGVIFKALGTEAAPALLPVLNNLAKANELLENQKTSAGAAAAAQVEAANTIQGQWLALNNRLNDLVTTLGSELAPVLIAAVEGVQKLVSAVQGLVSGFKALNAQVQGIAQPLQGFADMAKQSEEVVNGLKYAMDNLAQSSMDLLGPLGQLVGLFNKVQKLSSAFGTVEEATEEVTAVVKEAVDATGQLATKQEQAKQAALGQADAEKQAAESLRELAAASQQAGGNRSNDVDQRLAVTQALLAAEQQINDAKIKQAEAELKQAETQTQRESITKRIGALQIANAEKAYQATVATAEAELQKAQNAEKTAAILQKQVQTEVALQRSKKIFNEYQTQALQAAREGVQAAQANLATQQQITTAVTAGAAATRTATVEAIKTAQAANTIKSNTDAATASANSLADAYSRAASAASSVKPPSGGGGGGGGATGGLSFDNQSAQLDYYKIDPMTGEIVERDQKEIQMAAKQKILAEKNRMTWEAKSFDAMFAGSDFVGMAYATSKRGGMLGPVGSTLYNTYKANHKNSLMSIQDHLNANLYSKFMADGGYVTGPTQAVVGEGGEPEYVIPASKMDQAMSRYSAGQRGDSVVPKSATVNVNYGGSTVNMGGTEYINKGDVPGLLNTAVNQTLKTLRRNSSSRLYAGFDR